MLSAIKSQLRCYPRIFDVLRKLHPHGNDESFNFLQRWSANRTSVTFIQIGASDGLRNDPFRPFILRRNWRGILVEPIPEVFALLKRNYAHKDGLAFVNAAISSEDGTLSFFDYEPSAIASLPLEVQLDIQRKASFDRTHALNALPPGFDHALRESPVRVLTVNSLLKEFWDGTPIDLLAIDAEGHETAIIESLDFSTFRPACIYYESHNAPKSARDRIKDRLHSEGYSLHPIAGDVAAVLHPQN